jgi:hypothetical protein
VSNGYKTATSVLTCVRYKENRLVLKETGLQAPRFNQTPCFTSVKILISFYVLKLRFFGGTHCLGKGQRRNRAIKIELGGVSMITLSLKESHIVNPMP